MELCSFSRLALGPHPATVQLYNLPCYGESEPGPTMRWSRMVETLEDSLDVLRGNTVAIVTDGEHHLSVGNMP